MRPEHEEANVNKENGYSPSYFLTMSCPKQSISADNHSYHDFLSIAKVKPDISVATRSFIIHLVSSSATRIAVDHKNRVTLILHGEIYDTKDNQAEFLDECFGWSNRELNSYADVLDSVSIYH